MNKKLLMGGVLGLVVLGAGAVALTSLGGSDSGERAVARSAHAASQGSFDDPFVYAPELGPLGLHYGDAGKLKGAGTPAPSNDGQEPAAGGSDNKPGQPAAGEDGDDAPGSEPGSGEQGDGTPPPYNPGNDPANGNKPKLPYNPQVNDAICDALGCDEPDLPFNPQVDDAICDALDCDQPGLPNNPDVNDAVCEAIDCDGPNLPIPPFKHLLCAILGNCEDGDDDDGLIHIGRNCDLGLDDCHDEPKPKPKLPSDAILSRH